MAHSEIMSQNPPGKITII